MTKRIIKVQPRRKVGEHYKADACIVWCFDWGFGNVYEKFVNGRKFGKFDPVVVGGGAKPLADAKDKEGRESLLRQIKTSVRLHRTKLVVLMLHSDCGAYGGIGAFGNDRKKEKKHHVAALRRAKTFLRKRLPRSVKIETWLSGFDALREI
jgi:Putative carbonic anhydrase